MTISTISNPYTAFREFPKLFKLFNILKKMEYDIMRPWETLDDWQTKVLNEEGNIVLRSGRQVGKSTVISIKAGEYAINNKTKCVMIIASVERQALLLFEKVLSYIHNKDKSVICKGKKRPTKHKLQLKNGSTILCLPTGDSGYGIRGHTIDMLIADEAAFIPEEVWTAVTPMLAITKGKIILLSTPLGKKGYFYRSFTDPTFKSFHVSAEDCPRKNQDFLDQERARMTAAQYAQEYLGMFVDKLMQIFPDELIKKCQTQKRRPFVMSLRDYYLGVDIARMGEDDSTFEIIDRTSKDNLIHVENLVTKRTLTTETTQMILTLEEKYEFNQIFIDAYGVGTGVFDQLLTTDETKRKVIAINHFRRPLDRDEKQKTKVTKEDIYNNLLALMERGEIQLLDDDEVFLSLKSIQYEIDEVTKKLKIFGSHAHIADGLVRAAWCSKDKHLNPFIM